MVHNLTPNYLTSLIPSTVNETSNYNLRNSNDIRTVNAEEQRNATTVTSFKYQLNQPRYSIPKFYYVGERQTQIFHTRLRTKCSPLNYYIFLGNLTDIPFCRCSSIENTEHYLLQCRLYQQQRVEIPNSVSQLCHVTLDVLLSGDSSFSIDINSKIFSIVQKFIKDSKRF